jgi:hypothetical protein
MSNEYNEAILEQLFEEGMELYKGDEKKAEKYARKRYNDLPEPDYKAEGGAAGFPDLTGDGKVTRKDILKGRGVPGFKYGGKVAKMESGGAVCRGMGAAMRGGKFVGVR